MTLRRPNAAAILALAASLAVPALADARVPKRVTLTNGGEVREQQAEQPETQPAPPEEGAPEQQQPSGPPAEPRASQTSPERWTPTRIPRVFDTRAIGSTYPGEVRRYRIDFRAPRTPRGFRWGVLFESVRRGATVYLNGRRIGRNRDPYTPFVLDARGLRPGKRNRMLVVVDSRKNPKLAEGWWNWGGIVRPVHLVPIGPAHLSGLGTMSRVRCKGPARRCKARLLLDGNLQRRKRGLVRPRVGVMLRSPTGRVTRKVFKLGPQRKRNRRVRLKMRVPSPKLWAPERPRLYRARITLRDGRRTVQVERRRIGLRSVQVKAGRLYLNNRRVNLRGASIHEDMPGRGAALTSREMDQIVADLKAVGANVTRAHYLMNERLLARFDREGIMVWNQAPIWQRDARGNLLRYPAQRKRALLTVRRTIREGRNHPSVITHSVANELTFRPNKRRSSELFIQGAERLARRVDPTLPVSIDIKSRAAGVIPEQFVYHRFDIIGINQYFGWYRWVPNFYELEPLLQEMRDLYPKQALVMTEFGAEGDPIWADREPQFKGGYAFQANHAERNLALVDRLPFMSGAIYWTIREFEIFPGWTGGAPRRPGPRRNTRHHKGLLTYDGVKKPVWDVVRRRFEAVPLYSGSR